MSRPATTRRTLAKRRLEAVAIALALSLFASLASAQPSEGPLLSSMEPSCTSVELLRTAEVSGVGLEGAQSRVHDGQLVTEGSTWNSPLAVQLKDLRSHVVFDLRKPERLQRLALQGDDNDTFEIEGSLDGRAYTPIWTVPPATTGTGLRTRYTTLPKAYVARFLRVRPTAGDGFFSVSELRAYCKAPTLWPPKLLEQPKKYGWAGIDNTVMVHIKGWAALFGTLLLISYVVLRNRPQILRRTRNLMLAALGLFGFLSFWNLGHFHFDHYIHIWEHYHYYIGAKYGPELRFSRLYECTAAADLSDGLRARVVKRRMRDLGHSNELGNTDKIVADPTRCTSHFTEARWADFRKDIRFFRGQFSRDRWDESQNDHGYNGTPVWAIAGRVVANFGDVSWRKIQAIGWIDSTLLVLMWAVVWWAFGWQATCVAALYWGFNFPARFYWNGGSMLRYDYLMWTIVGICFLKKQWHFGAGMALTYATLLRIFPGFVVAALVLKALARMVRERRFVVSKEHLRFAAGCIVAMALLMPASSWATGGLDAWGEFAQNSQKHLKTALTNNMGLKTALGFDWNTRAKVMRNSDMSDPFWDWKDARLYFYTKRQPILLGLLLLFCIILARASDREPDWSAACLGAGLIAMASELTCYYYCFLLTYGLLWERRKLPGIAATALAALTCLLSEVIGWNDEHFAAMSVAYTIVIVGVTAQAAFGKRVEGAGTLSAMSQSAQRT